MFKNVLKLLRNSKSLTQEQLALKLGTSKSAISMYENGNREPDFEMLETIADFFNVDLDYLIKGSNAIDKEEKKLLTNYNKLDTSDKTKLVDYSDELVNSDKYKETVTISIAARNGAKEMELTSEQYQKFLKVIEENKDKEVPDIFD